VPVLHSGKVRRHVISGSGVLMVTRGVPEGYALPQPWPFSPDCRRWLEPVARKRPLPRLARFARRSAGLSRAGRGAGRLIRLDGSRAFWRPFAS
jgi:hypothetical protein